MRQKKKGNNLNPADINNLEKMFNYFKTNFIGKKITYTYNDSNDLSDHSQLKTCDVIMQKQNFLHLTGLIYSKNARDFYNDLEKNTLDRHRLFHDNMGFSKLKIGSAEYLSNLKTKRMKICNEKEFLHLKLDKAIRDDRIALSLKKDRVSYIPLSISNLENDIQKSVGMTPLFPIVKIEELDFKTQNQKIIFNDLNDSEKSYEDQLDELIENIGLSIDANKAIMKKDNEIDI